MKILFITAHPFLPQMHGGMQRSTSALMKALIARGHHASLLCALMPNGWLGKLGRFKIKISSDRQYAKDTGQGFPVYRAWFPWDVVETLIAEVKPDVVVVLARLPVKMALAAQKTGVPIVMMLQDVEFDGHGGEFSELGNIPCVANSQFTANRYGEAYGVNPEVIHPLIFPEEYKVESTRKYVTFINPVRQKGVDVALKVAEACPDIPFLFQEAWPLTKEQRDYIEGALSKLPNVTLQRPVSDMRQVYGQTRILLAPSQWEEAYGRVASEVQLSGIPVVASNAGGLPEAVGEGGVLLDPKGEASRWIDAVSKLWKDETVYSSAVNAALRNAARPQIDTKWQIDKWESILLSLEKSELYKIFCNKKDRVSGENIILRVAKVIFRALEWRLLHYYHTHIKQYIHNVRALFYVPVAEMNYKFRGQAPRHTLPQDLIISLTSYPPRFPTLALTLKSLLRQNVSPDKVILWIAEGDMDQLPADVLALKSDPVFEIRSCEDLGSYKKMIPAIEQFPNVFTAIADDDAYYPRTWLKGLLEKWSGDYKTVIAHRTHRIVMSAPEIPAPYKEWDMDIQNAVEGDILFPTGVGGVLYPPNAMTTDVVRKDMFMDLCKNGDDIWFFWMAHLNGSKIVKTDFEFPLITWPSTQAVGLLHENVAESGNDRKIQNMIGKFGWPVKM